MLALNLSPEAREEYMRLREAALQCLAALAKRSSGSSEPPADREARNQVMFDFISSGGAEEFRRAQA
ncbi:MAG TPA: hypothetical protein VFQ72_00465 [Candidatus Paceibacterota bacterium]|nr:hypothetical protein [Candidatus Paceibacterota bacterium]